MSQITVQQLSSWCQEFGQNPHNRVMQNAISSNLLTDLAVNRDIDSYDRYIFSLETTPRMVVTNQKSSGRCWEFAAFNIIRRAMIKKYNLPPSFQLSQSHFFFWDKLERMNYNLERIIDTSDQPLDSRLVQLILSDPVCDGGQWDMFVNIIKKHGVVPQSTYRETKHSSNSGQVNGILKRKFREYALHLRNILKNGKEEATLKGAHAKKAELIGWVYGFLCKVFGTPPTSFRWEYKDKDNKCHMTDEMTPQEFLKNMVPFDPDDYVCVINDPRSNHPYRKLYTVEHLGNVEGGRQVLYLNLPITDLKALTKKCIQENEAVWFGCDVGKARNNDYMDDQLMEVGPLLDTTFPMTKEERLIAGESLMTHAMVFSACNVGPDGNVDRYEVENSWGSREPNSGYYAMSGSWFTEFVYEIAVHKKHLSPEHLEILEQKERIVLPLWDPMGALA